MEKVKKISVYRRNAVLCGAIGFSAFLSGCSTLGVGESEYGCQGKPEGVRCISARDAYTATEDRDQLKRTDGAEKGKKNAPAAVAAPERVFEPAPEGVSDGPIPLRTPSRVMRIRLNYWEDANGDLNVPGYIYTEIEPRRWQVGVPAEAEPEVLRPLQRSAPDTTAKQKSKPTARDRNPSSAPPPERQIHESEKRDAGARRAIVDPVDRAAGNMDQ